MRERITHERLLAVLHYEPSTGAFTRRSNNKLAGCYGGPYVRVFIDGVSYLGHVLARFYMTGAWPTGPVDHWDTDGLNNEYDNLRPATPTINAHNRWLSGNTTGALGVTVTRAGRFQARIFAHGKRHALGCFETVKEAETAYLEAKGRLHPSSIERQLDATCHI